MRAMAWAVALAVTASASARSGPSADDAKKVAHSWVDDYADVLKRVNGNIWSYAETGLEETKSSRELIDLLKEHGFTVEQGVAGMPTAFVATYGSGRPVVGILAEYDA